MDLQSEKYMFNSSLNFRRVTYFRLCLLETQVAVVQCTALYVSAVQRNKVWCGIVQFNALNTFPR